MRIAALLPSRRLGALVLLIAAALVTIAHPGDARAESRIVAREGARKLVAVAPRGGAAQTLVQLRHGVILGTAASPNGAMVAFASRTFQEVEGERAWTDRIWTMRAGGRPRVIRTIRIRGIARGTRAVDSIALSPDGRKLLLETRGGEVFVLRADGSGERPVNSGSYEFGRGEGRNSTGPEFTPDGRRIIATFYPRTARPTDIGGIGTVALAGGPIHFFRRAPFVDGVGHFLAPTISADGRIAFEERWRSGAAIAVMGRDGSGVRRLARRLLPGWQLGNPSFSPSGRSLTFVGVHSGAGPTIIGKTPSGLFTIRLDGRDLHLLRTEPAHLFGRDPVWVRSPRAWAPTGSRRTIADLR